MAMIKAARCSLIVMLWLIAGVFMLVNDEPALGAMALLSGLTLPTLVSGWVLARSRIRQGKPDTFIGTFADWASLSRGDVILLVLSAFGGFGLAISAFVVFSVGS
jgi:hypothetical protein